MKFGDEPHDARSLRKRQSRHDYDVSEDEVGKEEVEMTSVRSFHLVWRHHGALSRPFLASTGTMIAEEVQVLLSG